MKMIQFFAVLLSVLAVASCDRMPSPTSNTAQPSAPVADSQTGAKAPQGFSIAEVVPGKFVDANYAVGTDGTSFKATDRLFVATKANGIAQGDSFDGAVKDSTGAVVKTASSQAASTGVATVNLDFGTVKDIGLKPGVYTISVSAKGQQKSAEFTVE